MRPSRLAHQKHDIRLTDQGRDPDPLITHRGNRGELGIDRGRVDEHVDAPVTLNDLVDTTLHIGRLGQVNGMSAVHLKTGCARVRDGSQCAIGVDVAAENRSAFPRKYQRTATADSRAYARDECYLAGQSISHRRTSLYRVTQGDRVLSMASLPRFQMQANPRPALAVSH